MKILALDLGTSTGWAYWDGTRLESGTQTFDLKRGESPGFRFLRFNAWLGKWVEELTGEQPDLLAYEAAHQRGGAATEIAAGFTTRCQEFCARNGIEHTSVHTATLKKFATGSGRADKEAMMKAVAERWKVCATDDEADAVAVLYWAMNEMGPYEPR